MFTGIIEEIGTVLFIKKGEKSLTLRILGEKILNDINLGDSVAVNGVCLTVSCRDSNCFTADVMAESLRRSSLGTLTQGSLVNLERAMPAQGRFGGHIVSGHIDATGKISRKEREDNAVQVTIETTSKVLHYIVEKGSIAIDGISLTISGVSSKSFQVSIIPHTACKTTLMQKNVGDIVNLENDIIAKYIERLIDPVQGNFQKNSNISLDFLTSHGF